MKKCKYAKRCKNYKIDSIACNELGGEYVKDGYCSTYKINEVKENEKTK